MELLRSTGRGSAQLWGNQGRLHSQVMLELSLKRIVGSEEGGPQHNVFAVTSVVVQLQEGIQTREIKTEIVGDKRGGGQILIIFV